MRNPPSPTLEAHPLASRLVAAGPDVLWFSGAPGVVAPHVAIDSFIAPDRAPSPAIIYIAPKSLWRIDGAGHLEGTATRPQEYEGRTTRFLDRALLGEG